MVQVLEHLHPSPLDLVRLGAASQVRNDVLARAAREPRLWRYYTPDYRPGAQQWHNPAARFVARLDEKPAKNRATILNHYARSAAVDAPQHDIDASIASCPQSSRSVGMAIEVPGWGLRIIDKDAFCQLFGRLHTNDEDIVGVHPALFHEEIGHRCYQSHIDDLPLMAAVSHACPELALLAGPRVLNNPTFLFDFALHAPCRPCEEEFFCRNPFPFHRLDEAWLRRGDVVATALRLRPNSYENLPQQMRRDPALFLYALQCFEECEPNFKGAPYTRWDACGRPFMQVPALFRRPENENPAHPGNAVCPSVYQVPGLLDRALTISPTLYAFLPDSERELPGLARRFLVGMQGRDVFRRWESNIICACPEAIRADTSCMNIILDKDWFRASDLTSMSISLREDAPFVARCAKKLGMTEQEVKAMLGLNFDGEYIYFFESEHD